MNYNIEHACITEHFKMSNQAPLPNFHFTVQSGIYAAREASTKLMIELAPLNLDVEETGAIELIIAEVLNNIVEHGYPDPKNGGPISIYCEQGNRGLSFKLIDKGLPMPDGAPPVGLAANIDVELKDLPEGGFGWSIIKNLAKDIVYTRTDDANRLDLRIAIAVGSKNNCSI
jgi:serine/threonine-protein kinase RsbW